jgi:hypothetical protein
MGKLIGLGLTTQIMTSGKFQRKHNDCLSIVIQERDRLQLPPLPDLSWVYEQYPTVESHPPNLVAELLERYCQPRIGQIQHGDLLCLRMGKEANLGMAYLESSPSLSSLEINKTSNKPDYDFEMWAIYASENGAAREPLHRRVYMCVESVWFIS